MISTNIELPMVSMVDHEKKIIQHPPWIYRIDSKEDDKKVSSDIDGISVLLLFCCMLCIPLPFKSALEFRQA